MFDKFVKTFEKSSKTKTELGMLGKLGSLWLYIIKTKYFSLPLNSKPEIYHLDWLATKWPVLPLKGQYAITKLKNIMTLNSNVIIALYSTS